LTINQLDYNPVMRTTRSTATRAAESHPATATVDTLPDILLNSGKRISPSIRRAGRRCTWGGRRKAKKKTQYEKFELSKKKTRAKLVRKTIAECKKVEVET